MNKFHEIFLDLEKKILTNQYPPQSLLPSENQLVTIYGVSRETIRKALNLLINAGYIQKQRGKGSIVLNYNRFDFPLSGLTSFKELQNAHHIPNETIVAKLEKTIVSPRLNQLTDWEIGSDVWELIRQRNINDEVVILDKDFILTDIVTTLPKEKAEDSIFSYFEDELSLDIAYSQKEIVVEPVTTDIQQWMDLYAEDTHVIVVKSLSFLEDTRCFGYTESFHRLDKFHFVEFARRRKI